MLSRRAKEYPVDLTTGEGLEKALGGCEKVQLGYYKVKVDQEREVAQGDVPWCIVRATQFHGFVTQAFVTAAKAGVLPLLRLPMQPVAVAVADVARAVADVVESEPRAGRIDVAGPEVLDARELAAKEAAAR